MNTAERLKELKESGSRLTEISGDNKKQPLKTNRIVFKG